MIEVYVKLTRFVEKILEFLDVFVVISSSTNQDQSNSTETII